MNNIPLPNAIPLNNSTGNIASTISIRNSNPIPINGSIGNVMIKSSDGTAWVNINDSTEKRLERIEKKLCILVEPSPEVLEKHKALKRAYEEYLILEKLILGEDR